MATLVRVDTVKELLSVSESKAYNVIKKLNMELEDKGYMTVRGRVPIDYLKERFNINDQDTV